MNVSQKWKEENIIFQIVEKVDGCFELIEGKWQQLQKEESGSQKDSWNENLRGSF